MNSPYSKRTISNYDSPYRGVTTSSPQTPTKWRFQSSQPSTPKKVIKISPKTGFKVNELRDPINDYQLNRNVRTLVFTPVKSSRANSNSNRDPMMNTFSGFHVNRNINTAFNNTKNDGFFLTKNTENDVEKDKWPEVNKTRNIFSSMSDFKPSLNFSVTPKISSIPSGAKEPYYFRFIIGRGNNDQIVRRAMIKRYWWKEGGVGLSHFIWQPVSSGIAFGGLNNNKNVKQMANHFERHAELSTKIGLVRNLSAYCEKQRMNLFDITPTTFVVDLHEPNYREQFETFLNLYKGLSTNPADEEYTLGSFFSEGPPKSPKIRLLSAPQTPRTDLQYCSPKVNDTMYAGANVWLLKPTEYNQGRGIYVFNKLSDLDHHLKCLQKGIEPENSPPKSPLKSPRTPKTKAPVSTVVKSHQFVIQKYLEKPLLIDNRKFDIRVWVLLDHEMNLYCFKEKYIRLSSEAFTLNDERISDRFVHLTNNAVQKYGKNYNKFESGNIISFHDLKKYLNTKDPIADFNSINKKIKDIIKISMNAGKDKVNPLDRKFCFEIFGFDFILDSDLNAWLIEINTNPSIGESNDLLSTLIPRMIDDALRLTIDRIFIPTEENYRPEDARDFDRQLEFPVNGYSSDENLWEHISNLRLVRMPKFH